MGKLLVLTAVLLVCHYSARAEKESTTPTKEQSTKLVPTEPKKSEDRLDSAQEKTILHQSTPYEKSSEGGFFSKLASWMYPFGSSDPVPAEGRHSQNQYLPPPSASVDKCNPCNAEPWIPVAGKSGRNTLIGFVQPSEFGHGSGPHFTSIDNLKPPQGHGGNINLPSQGYGPPSVVNHGPGLSLDSGPGLNLNLGPGLNLNSGPGLNLNTGPGLNLNSGQGLNLDLGPPPRQNFGHYGPPKPNYGPPPPNNNFFRLNPPNHRDPKIPFASSFGNGFGNLGPPPAKYGPPQAQYGAPPAQYGPPPAKYGPPPAKYGPPPAQYGPPPPKYGPPPAKQYGPPPPQQYGPPPPPKYTQAFGIPYNNNKNNGLKQHLGPQPPLDFRPPPPIPKLPISSYGIPLGEPSKVVPNFFNAPQDVRTILNPFHGAPIGPTGSESYNNNHHQEQIQLGSAPVQNPVPLPNLSAQPLAPLYNHGNFKQEYSHADDIQIIKSIPIADFLSTVEHPINVIQSPIVEVTTNEKDPGLDHGNHQNQYDSPLNNNPQINTNTNIVTPINNHQTIDSSLNFESHGNQNPNFNHQPADFNHNFGLQGNQNPNFVTPVNLNPSNHGGSGPTYIPPIKLSENPIVVEDTHTAASNINATIETDENKNYKRGGDKGIGDHGVNHINHLQVERFPDFHVEAPLLKTEFKVPNPVLINHEVQKDIKDSKEDLVFTLPSVELPTWNPKPVSSIPTSMVPPPFQQATSWNSVSGSTTKKPKQLQIIIPYTTNNNPAHQVNSLQGRKVPAATNFPVTKLKQEKPQLPLYTQPPTLESVWHQFDLHSATNTISSILPTEKPTTSGIFNIKELLKNEREKYYNKNPTEKLPFDIIRLQKNIDGWTEQEFSKNKINHNYEFFQKPSTTSWLVPSKKIPNEYLTTQPYASKEEASTTPKSNFYDHEPAGSSNNLVDLDNNLINHDGTKIGTTTAENVTAKAVYGLVQLVNDSTPSWKEAQVSILPETKEKIYVVTPQPKFLNLDKKKKDSDIKSLIRALKLEGTERPKTTDDIRDSFGEWPHLINNLETTTRKLTTKHPLVGLMDISSYTPPPNTTVETYSGHSKVITIITPAPSSEKTEETKETEYFTATNTITTETTQQTESTESTITIEEITSGLKSV